MINATIKTTQDGLNNIIAIITPSQDDHIQELFKSVKKDIFQYQVAVQKKEYRAEMKQFIRNNTNSVFFNSTIIGSFLRIGAGQLLVAKVPTVSLLVNASKKIQELIIKIENFKKDLKVELSWLTEIENEIIKLSNPIQEALKTISPSNLRSYSNWEFIQFFTPKDEAIVSQSCYQELLLQIDSSKTSQNTPLSLSTSISSSTNGVDMTFEQDKLVKRQAKKEILWEIAKKTACLVGASLLFFSIHKTIECVSSNEFQTQTKEIATGTAIGASILGGGLGVLKLISNSSSDTPQSQETKRKPLQPCKQEISWGIGKTAICFAGAAGLVFGVRSFLGLNK